jgi:putative ABC transport system substrate-binding protein
MGQGENVMNKTAWISSLSGSNLKSKIQIGLRRRTMNKNISAFLLATILLAAVPLAEAQQPKVYRVGVITAGGAWYEVIDGLRVGLRDLGLEEGKQFILAIRDTKGDAKAAEEAARNFERDKVDLLYAVTTSVTIVARRATADIPIVFLAGLDPVVSGLVDSFAKPGGRLTGVHFLVTDLTAKRLEILKEILPKLRRVVTFYDPNNRMSNEAARLGREEAKRLGLNFVERHVTSVEELRQAVQTLKGGEADAYFYTTSLIVTSQAQLIIDTARAKKLATMSQEQSLVVKGALASYGVSYHEAGRMSARYVQRILAGTNPKDLAVEGVDKIELIINLKTAKQIGLTIPPNVLVRANKVIK